MVAYTKPQQRKKERRKRKAKRRERSDRVCFSFLIFTETNYLRHYLLS